jgi:Xaa-Pro aminopeptidase
MEIKQILEAVAKAYKDFKDAFKYGQTTDSLLENFKNSLKESLGEYEMVYDYIWGKDSLNIDGETKGYVPQNGDTLIMDISVGKNGVWCDVCRTFFVGNFSKEQEDVFEMIKQSIRKGQESIRVGAKASDVYNAVNGVYALRQVELVHHAGHQIGEKPLMQPQFLADNDTLLQEGCFYTVESGLYCDFGIRLENDYLLNNDGAVDCFEQLLPLDIKEYVLK